MIAIVDYGLGNVKAFANIYKRLNIPYFFAKNSKDLQMATHIILPGVGAFDFAMKKLNQSGMRATLDDLVQVKKIPVLGICVGMQIMAKSSEEGKAEGLGWINSRVVKFKSEVENFPLPHMGWNNLEIKKNLPLFKGLDTEKRFYFLHSYHFEASCEGTIAISNYSSPIGCVINVDNVFGIQCHPEKSHHNGVALLKNFYEVCRA
ncbi:imidazole glycerol phosphate synthase subunit HisH [Psychrosphaera ytuae]|uniref:Imidazole glycerol phosphate synthase subunit HisH n=1 Tax=Psychrosphaera ytuae TaxID=2820710 RepID=A0A975DCV9_9GAMM|nr:imidazole glycerol phosphate synthase subunit HisH [Psychrosphaera ytuae]QTH64624.1 imidazole glycerol phosphate synthase subunit HisH [Psychrosphaera ytuae]